MADKHIHHPRPQPGNMPTATPVTTIDSNDTDQYLSLENFLPHTQKPALPKTAFTQKEAAKCSKSISLLMDASHSISPFHWKEQVNATAAALESDEIVALIEKFGPIEFNAMGFGGSPYLMVDWTMIKNKEDAQIFAKALRAQTDNKQGYYTNMDLATAMAELTFEDKQCPYSDEVIDISTDGVHQTHPQFPLRVSIETLKNIRDRMYKAGITLNGIGVSPNNNSNLPYSPYEFLDHFLVTKPQGFAMEAGWDNYAEMIKEKLGREIMLGQLDASEPLTPTRTPNVKEEHSTPHQSTGTGRSPT